MEEHKDSASSRLSSDNDDTNNNTPEGAAIVRVLAAVLERLTRTNNTQAHQTQQQHDVTKFHALKPPQITILAYLERIYKYASCSSECFVLALIYIDRLIAKNNFLLTELNVMLAAKFFDDAYYNNAYYAKVGGIAVSELNILEVDFLFRIHFELHCVGDIYVQYHEELVHHALHQQVQQQQQQVQYHHQTAAVRIPMPQCTHEASTSIDVTPSTSSNTGIVLHSMNHAHIPANVKQNAAAYGAKARSASEVYHHHHHYASATSLHQPS